MMEFSAWNGGLEKDADMETLTLPATNMPAVTVTNTNVRRAPVIGAAAISAQPDGASPRRRLFLLQPLGMWVNEDGRVRRHQAPSRISGPAVSSAPTSLPYGLTGSPPTGRCISMDTDVAANTAMPVSIPTTLNPPQPPHSDELALLHSSGIGLAGRTHSLPPGTRPLEYEKPTKLRRAETRHTVTCQDVARLSDFPYHQSFGYDAFNSAPALACTAPAGLLAPAAALSPVADTPLVQSAPSPTVAPDMVPAVWPGMSHPPDVNPCPDMMPHLTSTGSHPGAAAAALWSQWAQGGEVLPEPCGSAASSCWGSFPQPVWHGVCQDAFPGAGVAQANDSDTLPFAAAPVVGQAKQPSCWADGGAEVWQAAFGEPPPGAFTDNEYWQSPVVCRNGPEFDMQEPRRLLRMPGTPRSAAQG